MDVAASQPPENRPFRERLRRLAATPVLFFAVVAIAGLALTASLLRTGFALVERASHPAHATLDMADQTSTIPQTTASRPVRLRKLEPVLQRHASSARE